MESTQMLESTQVLDSQSGYVNERIVTPVKVATLTVDGVDYSIWNGENTIGRDAKCSVVLNSKAVSVEQAVIEADLQGGHFICDVGSTNKTKLGDIQLKPRVKYFIKDGDSLKIANLKGVYSHVKIAKDQISPETPRLSTAEVTAIPESPERNEDDAVESIIAETPLKDEGNGADSSDGDLFCETTDSSALFVRPLKLSSANVPSRSGTNSKEFTKTDAEIVCSLENKKPDASIYAAASQSIAGDQSSVLQGNEVIDESSATDADSSDLVVGSQPLFSPEKRLFDPNVFDCDTVPPVAHNFDDELTEPPKDYGDWENIDDAVDEISTHMDTIDSLVESNELQVTYTPPKRETDDLHVEDVGVTSKPSDKAASPSSSPNMKKFNKNKIVRNLDEDLNVLKSPKSGQTLLDSVIPENDKPVSIYESETQDKTGDESNIKTANAAMKESCVDESTDIVVGSQPSVPMDRGVAENMFTNDTVPMGDPVNDEQKSNCNIFDVATQQVQNESGMEGYASRNDLDLFDLDTQPFAVPEDRNGEKMGLPVEAISEGTADIGTSDLPTQAVSCVAEPDHDRTTDKKPESALKNPSAHDCSVSISDMATQPFAVPEDRINTKCGELSTVNKEKMGLPVEAISEGTADISISDLPTQAVSCVAEPDHDRTTDKKPESALKNASAHDCSVSISDMATQPFAVPEDRINTKCEELSTVNKEKMGLPVEAISEGTADISISDLPTQAVSCVAEPGHDRTTDQERESALENASLHDCNVSISDMATQGVSVVETNRELGSICETSISDMANQVAQKKHNDERGLEQDKTEFDPCDISLSDIATQASVPKSLEQDVSAPPDERKPVQSNQKTSESKNDTVRTNENDPPDSEGIYDVATQLPVGHLVLEESNTHLLNSDVKKAFLDVSVSDMLTQPSKVKSDEMSGEHHVADVSISNLPTQVVIATNHVSASAESLSNVKLGMENEQIEDIFSVMTQMPVSKDKILLEASDTQLLNPEVEKGTLDVSLSDMMTQPTKSNLGMSTADISISDLPTQAPAAERIGSVVNQDSEDIYNVMTQMPVESEKILLDVSDTQELTTDLENCERELIDSELKSERSFEMMKNDEIQLKIPTRIKNVEGRNRENIDVHTMDTQPMDVQNTSEDPNPVHVGVVDNKPASSKSVNVEIPACAEDGTPALAIQEANNKVPVDSVIRKDEIVDIYEVDTVPIENQSEPIHGASENAPSCKENARVTVHTGTTDNEVVRDKFVKEPDESCDQLPVVLSAQEIGLTSVEDRIMAMSDKNVNSFATQQILTSSNTKSTVAELLETLGDASSQVVRVNKKVIRLDYTDSEDSNSPVIRSSKKAKTLAEPDSEEDNESPLVVPKKSCRPLKESQDEIENFLREFETYPNTPAHGSDSLQNGSDDHPGNPGQKATPSITASPKRNEFPKSSKSKPLKRDVPRIEENKSVKEGSSKASVNSGALKDSITDKERADVENIESSIPSACRNTDNLTRVEEKTKTVEPSGINNTGGTDSLQLHLSVDASLNKSTTGSVPTTPEKQNDGVFNVTPSIRNLKELSKTTPETPEIPEDFFGTPMFHDKPVLRQYVNKKKLSLSSTSLLKGPNASSTPKSDLDSHSVLEMEETLQSPKKSANQTRKVVEVEQKTIETGYSTPKNAKKFKKTSPKKRKSAEMFENSSEDSDVLNSQEPLDSQEFGRGKRRKQRKIFFGNDDNEDAEFIDTRSSMKDIESVQGTHHSEKRSTSPSKAAPLQSLSVKNLMSSGEKAVSEKTDNRETVKRQCDSETSSSKKAKLSSEVEGVKRLSDEMELTCVRLEEDVKRAVVNVKKFQRASPQKLKPVSLEVIPKKESSEPSNINQRTKKSVSTSESESGKDNSRPNRNKSESSNPATTFGGASSSTSPSKSLRGRNATDMKQNADSEIESRHKSKRNRVQNSSVGSQETPKPVGEDTISQEISIKSMANRLQGAMKSQNEEHILQSNGERRTRQNSGGQNTETLEDKRDVYVGKGSNISDSPSLISRKKEVTKRGRPRKAVDQNEETVEKTEESTANIEPNKSSTMASVRRKGRRKLKTTQEDSEIQASSSSSEVSIPKRGRRAKNVAADDINEIIGLSDSQNAPSAATSEINVSKTKSRGKTTPYVEDSSAFETDQDSQSQGLSQGRRSGRARKKKESFDEIMSRKEEEIRLKKLEKHSALSQSPDRSRSTSLASVASSSKTEEDGSVMSAPKRRGRPKKSVSSTSTPTSSVDDGATFSVPSSPAASNSSRRKTPRSGSSLSQSVEAETSQKQKEKSQNSMSVSAVKVMFTGLADAKLSSMVKKLGGKVVEKPSDCTVLVTDKVRRTVKFLCALGLGKPIVSPNWLAKSKSFNKFTETKDSLLQDSEAEEKFDFELKNSLEKAKNSRLLEGYSFYATPSVLPPPAEIKPIVECSGGTYLVKPPAKWDSNSAIISSPKDKSHWPKLSKHGVLPPILSAEALLSGVLQQKFDFSKHRLK